MEKRFDAHGDCMTLGELRDALATARPEAEVQYNMLGLRWDGCLRSWRGIYAEPAIGWQSDRDRWRDGKPVSITVADMLREIDDALGGREFAGYKGGTYRYGRSSPVHVDNRGDYTSTNLVGVVVWTSGEGDGTVQTVTLRIAAAKD